MVFRLRHNGSRRKMKINAGALTISAVAADQLVQVALRRAQAGNYSTSVNDSPDFSSRKMAATPDLSARELDPVFAHDTAERPRAFGAKGQTTVAPPSFGRKVI
jgi:hypothetical protein